jgi:DNA-binding NarL/FixJ family response regulator/tetratricopeptide (TPR) repeat protein
VHRRAAARPSTHKREGRVTVAPTDATVPLQWPLVGRHEQVELFAATLDDPRAHGFVIHGVPGVGKTRLADHCLAVADARGRNVARATATERLGSVPLGALAHLMPPGIGDERVDLVKVMAEVRPVLVAQGEPGRLVLFVDDLQLLDATSAALIGQLLDADLLFLLATVRAGTTLPAGLDAVWQRGRVRRVDLVDLDRPGVDTLMHLVLGGPVEQSTVNDMWNVSQGNPLFVRELVLGALDAGHLFTQHDVWRLVGPLITTPRLREVVEARLGNLHAEGMDALDRVAAWEPIGLATLEAAVGHDQLEQLDRAGLLTVHADGRRQQVTVSHPLYREILLARMPLLTRRRLLLDLADLIDGYGARRREDHIRSATARLEATGWADPELLVRAARLARVGHDFVQVERLAQAARVDGSTTELGLLLGEALHELGRFTEADAVLRHAESGADDDDPLLAPVVEILARNLMWGLMRDEEALAANGEARRRATDPAALEELALNEALLLAYSGHPADALAVIGGQAAPSNERATALRAIVEVPSLIATGHALSAAAEAAERFEAAIGLDEQIAIPDPAVLVIHRIYALAEAGRIAHAIALASAAYEATPASAPPDGRMWLSHQLGRCNLLAGRPATARRWFSEALARCDAMNNTGPSRLVLSLLVVADVYLGDRDGSEQAAALLAARPPFSFTRPEQELGRAWASVAGGDLATARHVLLAAADQAASTGYRCCEAWALHDVARLGDPGAARDRLAVLAAECEGDLIAAYAVHAAAAASGDADGLVDAADRFERMGTGVLAAEAANEAAQAFQDRGDRRAATALKARASALVAACEGAHTPGVDWDVAVTPLTPRERDIAMFAARGESSRSIAERLVVSVRTVDNHLQNVYTKLGISGRRQLAEALAIQLPEAQRPPPSSLPR